MRMTPLDVIRLLERADRLLLDEAKACGPFGNQAVKAQEFLYAAEHFRELAKSADAINVLWELLR